MKRLLTLVVVGFSCALIVQVTGAAAPQAQAPAPHTVYFSVFTKDGAPVTDLTPADLTVKEGGKQCAITSVAPATAPMEVVVIDDDYGTGSFQLGTGQLLQRVFGHGEFSLMTLNPQVIRLVEFSKDAKTLQDGLNKLGQRNKVAAHGNQLDEAVIDAANDLEKQASTRRAIVIMTMAGEHDPSDQSGQTVDPQHVLDVLRDSGASLHAIYITGAMTGPILGDGPKQSGGTAVAVGAAPGLEPAVQKIADALLSQEVVTYTLPSGAKPSNHFELKVNRKDVKVLAPQQIPKQD